MNTTTKVEYSFWLGCWKSVKNNLIVFLPAFLAFLANVPIKFAWIASVIVYFLKNLYEVKSGNKLF